MYENSIPNPEQLNQTETDLDEKMSSVIACVLAVPKYREQAVQMLADWNKEDLIDALRKRGIEWRHPAKKTLLQMPARLRPGASLKIPT